MRILAHNLQLHFKPYLTMKYNIRINQYAIINNGFDLDLIDAAILDFFESFVHTGKMATLYHNNKSYYWFDYKKIIEEMPMLGIKSKDGVYRRIKSMCEQELLEAHPSNKELNKPFYTFGRKFHLLAFSTAKPTDGKPTHRALKSEPMDENRPTTGSNADGPTDENSDNYSIIDNTINHTISDNSPAEPDLPFKSLEFKEAWAIWEKHIGEKLKTKRTPTARRLQLKKCSDLGEARAIAALIHSAGNGYTGIYEENKNNYASTKSTNGAISAVIRPGSIDYEKPI